MNIPAELNERATELMQQWMAELKAGNLEKAKRHYADAGVLLKLAYDATRDARCAETEDLFE